MTCHEHHKQIDAAAIDGQGLPSDTQLHVEDCQLCSRHMAAQAEITDLLCGGAEPEIKVPVGLHQLVMEGVRICQTHRARVVESLVEGGEYPVDTFAHLDGCKTCSSYAQEQSQLSERLMTAPPELVSGSEELHANVMAVVRQIHDRHHLGRRPYAAWAAAAMFVGLVSIALRLMVPTDDGAERLASTGSPAIDLASSLTVAEQLDTIVTSPYQAEFDRLAADLESAGLFLAARF